jgi:hypothetical protein
MAQWIKENQKMGPNSNNVFEVSLLGSADGALISNTNPLPVSLGNNSVTITGPVTIPGSIEITNDEGNPIPTHAHLFNGEDEEYSNTNPLPVSGNVNITTLPNVTINGPIAVTDNGSSLTVDGNVGITGDVNVTQGTDPWVVSGNVNVDNFPATQTVDGTVNIGTLPEVEVKNDTGNPISVIGTTINPFGKLVVSVDDDTVQHTSTNRRKVSNYEITEFNTFQYTKDPLIWDEEVTGTASSTLDPYEATLVLSVGTATGDRIERQTKRVLPYIPGRENEVIMHFKLNAQQTGIVKRLGILDETSGIYLEDDGTTYNVVLRKTTAGGTTETRIARANWNGDKLDGTGPSGITIDFTKFQTMVIEYNWFTGHTELKFVLDNYTYPFHQFEFNNSEDTVITNTPFLPIKWDIHNTTGAAGTHTMEISSYATLSEAGQVPLGVKNTVTTPLDGITCTDALTFYPILSIRLRVDRIKGIVLPQTFQVAALDNSPVFYKVLLNPTLAGANTWSTYADTHIEFNTDATAVAEGDFIVDAGYIDPNGQGAKLPLDSVSAFQLGRENMGTTSEIITIAAATGSANKEVYASFGWIEVR